MAMGVHLLNDYSGMGSSEQVAHNIELAIQNMDGVRVSVGFRSVRACDIYLWQRRVLLAHTPGPGKPSHIFKDLMELVPS